MAAITITDNGASIKITRGTEVRNIIKAQIIEISVIKTNIIKIDLGLGALQNIFLPFEDVTHPSTGNAEGLRDAINALLTPVVSPVVATEARQSEQINILNTLNASLQALQTLLTALDKKIFQDPLLIDDGGAGVIYRGYALVGTDQTDALWAIERIEKIEEVSVHKWANGRKSFENRWTERETLTYS